jgi:pilus assembly protein CpaF
MSLLNCVCAAIPARERVVTCEEVFELRFRRPTSGNRRLRRA